MKELHDGTLRGRLEALALDLWLSVLYACRKREATR